MKRFTRTIEDFTCLHCHAAVEGDGYTNHCPHCLWSRHVDIHPGDRKAACKGMMEPIQLILLGDSETIVHRCVECGFTRNNKVADKDSREARIELAALH